MEGSFKSSPDFFNTLLLMIIQNFSFLFSHVGSKVCPVCFPEHRDFVGYLLINLSLTFTFTTTMLWSAMLGDTLMSFTKV